MSTNFLNFTAFDIQVWPPPSKTDPKVYAEHTLNPSLWVPLLLLYHSFTSIILQAPNFRDYRGRRDTVWYQFCLGHLLVLELFMIYFLFVYQKHCSLSENIGLLLYAVFGNLVHAAA